MDEDITDDIENIKLTWFGQVKRMPEGRCRKKILEQVPPGKRKKERPK